MVQAARNIIPARNLWDQGKLIWLLARIESDLGELSSATSRFEEAVAIFRKLHYGETALVTCELARVLLAQGRHTDAFEAAASLRGLLEPLRGNKIISAAIGDLLRSGQRGLTLTLVQRVKARIEGERQTQDWRSLQI
jgi:hypothetical protein